MYNTYCIATQNTQVVNDGRVVGVGSGLGPYAQP